MAENLFGKIDSRGSTPVTYNFTPLSTAEAFSISKSYAVGDYCFYGGDFYKCTTAKAAGAWSADNFEKVTISEELKDIVNGYHPDMTAGDAEQLVSTQYVTEKTPYLYRTTGGSSDVGNREYVRGITGGTVAWNQLCNGSSVTVPSGHKYLSKISTTWSVSASTGAAITGLTGGSDMVIDLTQLFGSTIADYIYGLEQANAGAGVAFFRKLFPKDYYPYNAGELKSVEGVSAHEMVGFNQWDEEWEVGAINASNGINISDSTRIRTKNYVPVLSDTDYFFCIKNYSGQVGTIVFYDANKNYVKTDYTPANAVLKTPKGVGFMRICFYANYGTTYKNDICINISNPSRNGQYEPYVKYSYPIDNSITLMGVPKLDASNNLYYDGDEYPPSGEINRRYSIVDLGTLTPIVSTLVTNGATIPISDAKKWDGGSHLPNGIVVGYTAVKADESFFTGGKEWTIRLSTSAGGILMADPSWADKTANEIKASLNGVYYVYELATPTTETADPYTEIQICDDCGTEEYVSTSIVPVGHTTDYPANLRDKLQHLPDLASADGNYIVSQTGTQMTLAPLPIVIPAPPTTDGNYTFRATVSNGVPTLSWVEE